MHRLYDYYNRRLLEANMRKEVAPIIEVENLLTQIRDTWAEMLLKGPSEVGESVLSR
jgi:flagellar protein FliS